MSEVTQLAESLHPHEVKVVSALKASAQREGLTEEDLAKAAGLEVAQVSAALGRLQLKGLVTVLSETTRPIVSLTETGKHYFQRYAPMVRVMSALRAAERVSRTYGLQELGHAVALQIQKEGVREEATRLTPEMLKDGSWRQVRFRKYTIALKPARIAAGKKHPYREFLDLVKAKLVSMGFEEMRGGLIENEFWDMDALFMPQFHPAPHTPHVSLPHEPRHSTPL